MIWIWKCWLLSMKLEQKAVSVEMTILNLQNHWPLIKACKKHNLKAQSQLYQIYKDDLFVLCLKYCKNREEAQDNLQDAFLDIFKNIKSYNGSGSFEGWMKRITIYKAIDKYKKKQPINIEIITASSINLFILIVLCATTCV